MPDKELDVELDVKTNTDTILQEFAEVLVKVVTNYKKVFEDAVKNDFRISGINTDDIKNIVYLINTILPDESK